MATALGLSIARPIAYKYANLSRVVANLEPADVGQIFKHSADAAAFLPLWGMHIDEFCLAYCNNLPHKRTEAPLARVKEVKEAPKVKDVKDVKDVKEAKEAKAQPRPCKAPKNAQPAQPLPAPAPPVQTNVEDAHTRIARIKAAARVHAKENVPKRSHKRKRSPPPPPPPSSSPSPTRALPPSAHAAPEITKTESPLRKRPRR